MTLLELEHIETLRANALAHQAAQAEGTDEPDHRPVVKLFNPVGAATWLVTEMDEDGDTLFGLADLGFGCPELGSFSLAEFQSVRLPFGMTIERDIGFAPMAPISFWSRYARLTGSIINAEATLREIIRKSPNAQFPFF
ncbi:Protein of unknown function [Sphingobium sp. AP50]|uniref:DUF2958 domain-containing protein n=1 Tax=Sphingobium sp. AP50 TaxID=1884369 RepID=UPI0008C40FA4|nr:DUF2958 domain-containing protein [Sphingobium sp. AP50]SEK02113.1 Protein of unknown function [Sphingobium sp. AP50]